MAQVAVCSQINTKHVFKVTTCLETSLQESFDWALTRLTCIMEVTSNPDNGSIHGYVFYTDVNVSYLSTPQKRPGLLLSYVSDFWSR